MPRRLAAIMFTDIAGYTSLSQTDEPAALRLLRDQERLVRGLLEVHRGRLVKSVGDGLLIEFPNALDGVECAVDLQRHIQERNAREPSPELRVRIDIHLGDVEGVGPDILGDAVNVASRIEPLAEPGGVCLSEPVYGQVRHKVSFRLEKLGMKTLKGVQEPLEVYRVVVPERAVVGAPPEKVPGPPRLAVLPFANISPDPRDEYFADGLTEELITILSQLQNLQVVARTSVIQYKTAPKPMDQIGAELAVTAVLEGSVRMADNRLRITVQLIDVASQSHIWANTYDRKLDDIFTIQTEVAKRISNSLKVKLGKAEEIRLEERPKPNAESYLAYLKGRNLMGSLGGLGGEQQLEVARKQFQVAISLDPQNAAAYAGLADSTVVLGLFFHPEARESWSRESKALAEKALELDPNLAEAHGSLALVRYDNLEWVGAEREFEKAIALSPSYSRAREYYASMLMEEKRTDEALREYALADESDPHSSFFLGQYVTSLIALRRMEEARVKLERLRVVDQGGLAYESATAYYQLAKGDFPGAIETLGRIDQLAPGVYWLLRVVQYVHSGKTEMAKSLLMEVEARPKTERPDWLAHGYAILGDLDTCFRLLDQAAKERVVSVQLLRNDPWYDQLRRDPRFAEALRKFGLT